MKTVLELQDLTIGYRLSRKSTKTVAEKLNLQLRAGELVCLLGPNGAGKSTLLRTVAGMQQPLGGKALLEGLDVHAIAARDLAKKLSVVLTELITIGTLSAYALVALGRFPHTNWAGKLTERDHEIIRHSIEIVGAQELANRNVSELSDGERQKVMVARALAQEPEVLILDEITAFLDLPRRVEITGMLRDLAHNESKAALLSTHDLDLALRTADTIWLMTKNGNVHTGAPEDLVLSGGFEAAFADEQLIFDRQDGGFRRRTTQHGQIRLVATGIEKVWTAKALERNGFEVAENGDSGIATVEFIAGPKAEWRVVANGQTETFGSLGDLTVGLKKLHRAN